MQGQLIIKDIRGLKTAWWENRRSDGPIFLLLHGFPDVPIMWEPVYDHLSSKGTVIASYVRGAKPSEPGNDLSRYSPEAIALDHIDILKTLDPDESRPVVLIGHDFGGLHAWYLAGLLGHRLEKLVIMNSLSVHQAMHRLSAQKQLLKSWYVLAFQIRLLPETIMSLFPKRVLRMAYGQQYDLLAKYHGNKIIDAVKYPINQYRALVGAFARSYRMRPIRLTAPVLIVWGKHDPFLVCPTQAEFEAEAEHVTIRILDAGHWFHHERREEFLEILELFLTSDPH